MSAALTVEDMDRLRHMLGIDLERSVKRWGYRNYYYVVSAADGVSMNRLAGCGWVEHVKNSLWIATREGCLAAGLPAAVAEAILAADPERRR